jgi:4'-phosphopantetheinyl transferase
LQRSVCLKHCRILTKVQPQAQHFSAPSPQMTATSPDAFRHRPAAIIELWMTHPSQCVVQGLMATYEALLSPPEKAQWQRFHFERDRHRYLVTRALVRSVLSKLTRTSPEALQFSAGSQGKPYLADSLGLGRSLSFNLSHTQDLVLLAVSRDGHLGVDVETSASPAPLEIIGQHFSPAEQRALASLPSNAEQGQHFWACWTLKESYLKATGTGLTHSLNDVGFALAPSGEITAQFDTGQTGAWFGQWRPTPDHLAALCLIQEPAVHAQFAAPAPLLHAWQTLPLHSEHPASIKLIRSTSVADAGD